MKAVLLTAALAAAIALPVVAAQRLGGDPLATFDRADANHDGLVTREEFVAARAARFDRMDRNRDGAITRDDLPRFARRRPQANERFGALLVELDTDGDGRATRAEVAAAPPRMFELADADRDGRVDKAELAALRERASARREAAR